MCRFVAYLGEEILLQDILVRPINSIVLQSLHARETTVPTNGDGFGLGWYKPDISMDPALFTSVFPAWNDRNLLNLTAKIKSPAFFAHVRAAGAGGVTNYNCHPFIYDRWMLMHNGDVDHFLTIKRHLRHFLDDDIYLWIKGETDSEHLFALFLQLAKGRDLEDLQVVADVLEETFVTINNLILQYNGSNDSFYNVCLTDGKRIVASRYAAKKQQKPESLHYSSGAWIAKINPSKTVLVSSERLTDLNDDWQEVPANHLLLVDGDNNIHLRKMRQE